MPEADNPRNAVPLNPEILQNAILNSSDFAIIATDAKGIIQLFNIGAERLLGYAACDVVNKITPSDIHDLQEVIARAEALSAEFRTAIAPGFDALAFKASRGIEDKYELTYIRKDGSRFPALVSITALRGDQGEIIGYLLIGTDDAAAHLVAANKEIVAAQMFRLAVEACTNGMVIADDAGKIVLVNYEIERLSGYRRDELIGQPVDILVPARLRTEYARHCDAVTVRPETGRIGASFDFLGLRKDGTEFPIEVGLNPVQVGAGLLILSVIVDISNRRRMERLKDEFVATVSHELRTPLTSIAGALGLLTAGKAGQLPEAAERLLTIAYTNSQRLVRLLNDILDIEKMELGKVVFDFKRVEVQTIVEQTIEANRAFAESRNVRIRLDSASAVVDVRADPDRLVQAITNLLSNAIKFSPSGEEVVVAIETRGETVHISVRDHGHGVPDEFKPRIFERFAQADATDARQKGGTGLGLSIVKQIVDRLDGAVGFMDAPGGGTIFHVELSSWARAIRAQSRHLRKSHVLALEQKRRRVSSFRLLHIDDEPDIREIVAAALSDAEFAVRGCDSGADGLTAAAQWRPDLILLDVMMPVMDGPATLGHLRENPKTADIPVVFMTARMQTRELERFKSLGAEGVITKPFDPITLAALVRSHMQPANAG
jgi:PAS domain S-box-containing protein